MRQKSRPATVAAAPSRPAMGGGAGKAQKGAVTVAVGGHGGAAGLQGDAGKRAEAVEPHTGSSGPVPHAGVTAAASFGGASTTFTNHAAASYLAVKGDGGSPVIHTDSGGSHKLLGIHAGSMLFYSEPPDDRIVSQNVSPTPGDDLTWQFSMFSTWENTERDLSPSWP
ncbi:MAG: hypothetical protein OXD41_01950 [Thaumarchaeota archaeon]|nr:hypothetical protein [Nitrososphaerota archaeon]